jgi:hypothetical protein
MHYRFLVKAIATLLFIPPNDFKNTIVFEKLYIYLRDEHYLHTECHTLGVIANS